MRLFILYFQTRGIHTYCTIYIVTYYINGSRQYKERYFLSLNIEREKKIAIILTSQIRVRIHFFQNPDPNVYCVRIRSICARIPANRNPVNLNLDPYPVYLRPDPYPVNLNTNSYPVNLNTNSYPVNLNTDPHPVNLNPDPYTVNLNPDIRSI